MHLKIIDQINKDHKKDSSDKLIKYINKFIKKITFNLDNFSYNIIILTFTNYHLLMKLKMEYGQKLKDNYKKMITLSPIIPHFANEALKTIDCLDEITWQITTRILKEDIKPFVIQINGKKRGLIQVKVDR